MDGKKEAMFWSCCGPDENQKRRKKKKSSACILSIVPPWPGCLFVCLHCKSGNLFNFRFVVKLEMHA